MNGQPHFFFDNNLSPDLAAGMKAFGESATHLSELYPDGDPGDVVWLEEIGHRGWFLVTRDRAIRRHPAEVRAYREHGVGGFVLSGKERSRCDLIRQLVRCWAQMKKKAESTRRPFLYRVPPSGGMELRFASVSAEEGKRREASPGRAGAKRRRRAAP